MNWLILIALIIVAFGLGYMSYTRRDPLTGGVTFLLSIYLAIQAGGVDIETACCSNTESYFGLQLLMLFWGVLVVVLSVLGHMNKVDDKPPGEIDSSNNQLL